MGGKRKLKKFIIWGCGSRGKQLAIELGDTYVEAIVDRNKEYHNKKIYGFNLISPEVYFKFYKEYPTIVTPKGYESIIIEELRNNDCPLIYNYNLEFSLLEYYAVQLRFSEIILNNSNNIVVGNTAVALALCMYLNQKNYDYELLIEEPKCIQNALENAGYVICKEPDDNNNYVVYITQPIRVFKNSQCVHLYRLEKEKHLTKNKYLEQFKDIHKNRRIFVIATGPSLKMEDLDKIHEHKELSISVNSIVNAVGKLNGRLPIME